MAKVIKTTAESTQGTDREYVGKGHPPKHSQWKKGQSGNPKGCRIKTKPLTTEYVKRLNDGEKGEALAQEMIDIALKHARKGDFRFWQELMNRSDGKVVDQIEHSGRIDSTISEEKFEEMNDESRNRLLRSAGITDVDIESIRTAQSTLDAGPG